MHETGRHVEYTPYVSVTNSVLKEIKNNRENDKGRRQIIKSKELL